MKKLPLIVLLMLLPFLPKAQEIINGKVIQLHSSVGEVITIDEKNKFVLFPEYKDSMYQSAMFIQHPDYTFAFLIKPKKGMGKSFERTTSGDEIIEMCNRIDKIEPGESFYKKNEVHAFSSESKDKTYVSQTKTNVSSVGGRIFGAVFGAVIQGIITAAFDGIGEENNDDIDTSTSTSSDKKEDAIYAPRGEGKSDGNRDD